MDQAATHIEAIARATENIDAEDLETSLVLVETDEGLIAVPDDELDAALLEFPVPPEIPTVILPRKPAE